MIRTFIVIFSDGTEKELDGFCAQQVVGAVRKWYNGSFTVRVKV